MATNPYEGLNPAPPRQETLLAEVHKWRTFDRTRPTNVVMPEQGQESVWDYPRPPRIETVAKRLRVEHAGATVADTTEGLRVLETSGAPTFYFPSDNVDLESLRRANFWTLCEWKGIAIHYDLVVGGRTVPRAAWSFPEPFDDLPDGYAALAGRFAFYPARVDACWVADVRVQPQPGGFYGGWVTPDIVGPIKGAPGSEGW